MVSTYPPFNWIFLISEIEKKYAKPCKPLNIFDLSSYDGDIPYGVHGNEVNSIFDVVLIEKILFESVVTKKMK